MEEAIVNKRLKLPYEVIVDWIKKIPPQVKTAFISTLVIGLLAHIYIMVNSFSNADNRILAEGGFSYWNTGLGRWFIMFPVSLSGIYASPFLKGMSALIYMGIVSVLVNKCLEIKNNVNIVLISGLIITIPIVASIFTYGIYSDAYCFGIMLAALAVWMTKRFRFGFAAGGILIFLQLGIYQAFMSFAAGLGMAVIIMDYLRGRKIIVSSFRILAQFIIGLLLYLASLELIKYRLSGYAGINGIYNVSLAERLNSVKEIFEAIKYCFTQYSVNFYTNGYTEIYTVLLILAAYAFIFLLIQQALQNRRMIFNTLIMMILLVLFCGIAYPMAPDANKHWIMFYSVVSIPVLAVAVVDNLTLHKDEKKITAMLKLAASWIITVFSCFYIIYNTIVTHTLYLRLQLSYNYVQYLASKLLEDIKENYPQKYKTGAPVVLAGSIREFDNPVKMSAIGIETAYTYALPFIMSSTQGIPNSIERESLSELYGSVAEAVKKMPDWPADGSIRYIDGKIIVRLGKDD